MKSPTPSRWAEMADGPSPPRVPGSPHTNIFSLRCPLNYRKKTACTLSKSVVCFSFLCSSAFLLRFNILLLLRAETSIRILTNLSLLCVSRQCDLERQVSDILYLILMRKFKVLFSLQLRSLNPFLTLTRGAALPAGSQLPLGVSGTLILGHLLRGTLASIPTQYTLSYPFQYRPFSHMSYKSPILLLPCH